VPRFRPKQAHKKAQQRHEHLKKHRKWSKKIEKIVVKLLKKKWSPEQISARMRYEGHAWVSHDRIYQFIEEDKQSGGSSWLNLRYSHRSRKRCFPSGDRRGQIKNTVSIEHRHKAACNRSHTGHWKLDSMISGVQGMNNRPIKCLDGKTPHEVMFCKKLH
jgi:transposase, IS30 family